MKSDSSNTSAAKATPDDDELRPSYDAAALSGGDFGGFHGDYVRSRHMARLEPDVAAAFPDEESVNEALRAVMHAAQRLGRQNVEDEPQGSQKASA